MREFLADLANANKSLHTLRCHRGDLVQFAGHHDGEGIIDASVLHGFFTSPGRCSPSSL
ncbi:MAG: hypothetical protein ACRDRH_12225 [Pseudonocardia sp.]